MVFHRIEAVLMNIHEWRWVHVVAIHRLNEEGNDVILPGAETGTRMFPYLKSTPFEGTVEILFTNLLPICMIPELQRYL